MKRRALVSVYDKAGLEELGRKLLATGFEIVASGGTATALAAAGIAVTPVEDITGYGTMLGGRVKTLHPKIHGAILADHSDQGQTAELQKYGIQPFELVICSLYPFIEALKKGSYSTEQLIELIDIGGPAMLRAAAKNYRGGVTVLCDPADYDETLAEIASDEHTEAGRRVLAEKAFIMTANYDMAIAGWMSDGGFDATAGQIFGDLKYGENPWQTPAGLFTTDMSDRLALASFETVEGDTASYVNMTDVDYGLLVQTRIAAAYELNFGFVPQTAVVIKHGSTCGAAVGRKPADVVRRAVAGNPGSAFGGVVVTNFTITESVAAALMERDASATMPARYDGVIGPEITPGAMKLLARKNGKCRMMVNPHLADLGLGSINTSPIRRAVRGGYLMQPNYTHVLDLSRSELHGNGWSGIIARDVVLGWAIGGASPSNTIVITRRGMQLANAVGQQSRIIAAKLAIMLAEDGGHDLKGSVFYSDSFFPMPDAPLLLVANGVRAGFASSGSVNDTKVIEDCVKAGLMLFMQPDKEVRGFARH